MRYIFPLLFLMTSHFALANNKQLLASDESCFPHKVFVYLETLEYTACLITINSEKLNKRIGILFSLKNISNKPITIFLPNEKGRELESIFYISEYNNPNAVEIYPPPWPASEDSSEETSNDSWLIPHPMKLGKNEDIYYKLYFYMLAPDIDRRLKSRNDPELSMIKSFYLNLVTSLGFLREGEVGTDFEAYMRRDQEYRKLLKEGRVKREYLTFIDVKIDWEKPITK